MFKFLSKAAICFLLFVSLSCYGTSPAVGHALLAELQTEQVDATGGTGLCTASAIGSHAIITAEHCDLKVDELTLRNGGAFAEAKIVGRIPDGFDHMIYLLSGVTFKNVVTVKVDADPDYAEDIFTIGNPGSFEDYYQRGYVSGFKLADPAVGFIHDTTFYSFQSFPGASGSGIFDPQGNLVGIVSMLIPQVREGIYMSAAGSFALHFTQEEVDRAVNFVPATK